MLAVDELRHVYGADLALALPQWEAAPGEHWLVHGPSGCGKTTLLHILAGLLTPSEGTVSLDGQAYGTLGPAAMDRFRGRHIGIVFQQLHLVDALTVSQNLSLACSLAGLPAADGRQHDLLNRLGLADKAAAYPHALSHGQGQRVALARAVINRPSLLLADEPTANLDDDNAARALALLREQASAEAAILVVASHDSRIEAAFDKRLALGGAS
jgi:putative ABC transport system ATP-binding protein